MKPLVSIITPSYNQGKFIKQSIESVLTQDYENIEYIVVDGGSTDGTLDILKQYSGRLKYVSEKDKGQADAINKGFKMAKGQFVAWLNSDDIYEPRAISKAVKAFIDCPDVALIYGDGYIIDEDGNIVKAFEYTKPFDLWSLLHVWDYIMQPATFFCAGALQEVGYLNEDLHWIMDWDLWIKLALKYNVKYINDFLACSREYSETKTSTGAMKRLEEIKQLTSNYTGQQEVFGYAIYYNSEMALQSKNDIAMRDFYHGQAMKAIKNIPAPDNAGRCIATSYFAVRKNCNSQLLLIHLTQTTNPLDIDIYVDNRLLLKCELPSNGDYAVPLPLKPAQRPFHLIQVEILGQAIEQIDDHSQSWITMLLIDARDVQPEYKVLQMTPKRLINFFNRKNLREQSAYSHQKRERQKNKNHPAIGDKYKLKLDDHVDSSMVSLINWHFPEEEGRWCSAKSAIQFWVCTVEEYHLEITFVGVGFSGDTEVLFNEHHVGVLRNGNNIEKPISIILPQNYFIKTSRQELTFLTPNAKSPADIGAGEDIRKLGTFVKEIVFTKGSKKF